MRQTGVMDRDRDASGRPRSARPRDGLGRPLPHGAAGVPRQPEGVARTPQQTLHDAQQLPDAGRPFHAHEVFEDAWKAACCRMEADRLRFQVTRRSLRGRTLVVIRLLELRRSAESKLRPDSRVNFKSDVPTHVSDSSHFLSALSTIVCSFMITMFRLSKKPDSTTVCDHATTETLLNARSTIPTASSGLGKVTSLV